MKSQLRPIETAPKNGTEVLLFQISEHDQSVIEVDVGVWKYDPGNELEGERPYYYWSTNNERMDEPTHWLPWS